MARTNEARFSLVEPFAAPSVASDPPREDAPLTGSPPSKTAWAIVRGMMQQCSLAEPLVLLT